MRDRRSPVKAFARLLGVLLVTTALPATADETDAAVGREMESTEVESTESKSSDAPEPRREIRIEYATVPMVRNAGLAFGGVQLAQSGLDLATRPLFSGALEGSGGWAIAGRAAWSFFIDYPLVGWGSIPNHELGHALRRPADVEYYTLRIEGPRIPLLFPGGGSVVWSSPRELSVWERMASTAGGWEADSLLSDRVRTTLYSRDQMHYGDAITYFTTKLGKTLYLLDGTSRRRLDSMDPEERHSDPLIYAEELAEIEQGPEFSAEAVDARARELRRGAYWNLADFTLWASAAAWIKGRVVHGERYSPAPWLNVGALGLAPGVSFTLTPYGPETTALTGWRVGGRSGSAYVRWTGAVDGERVVGGGGSFRLDGGPAWLDRLRVDMWGNQSGSLGARFELGGVWRRSERDRLGLSWTAGVKSRGPLVGFPEAAKGYAAIGLSLDLD